MCMKIVYEPRGAALEYSPLACNIYIGCEHACKYCYAPRCMKRDKEQFHSARVERKDAIKNLRHDLAELREKEDLREILFCFVADPYSRDENPLTTEALKVCREFDHPFQILTKGGLRAVVDFDLYSDQDTFASTLTFIDEEKSSYYEPGAPLPSDRIAALRLAHLRGIRTWVSFEPVIDPEETYRLFDATKKYVYKYKIGKVTQFKTEKEVDWAQFTRNMIQLCESNGKDYLIKDSLKKYL